MKIFATMIALATVLASPVYAKNLHHRPVATAIDPSHRHTAGRDLPMFLLEDRRSVNTDPVTNFQDNWDVSY